MKYRTHNSVLLLALLLATVAQTVCAETVNAWRGTAIAAEWSESYKWHLHHPPSEGEAAHFREDSSVISVNSTIQLDKGMHLYGEKLLLKGNGNINLWSPIPYDRSVNIPASSSGYANLTLSDNLSLNGRISLSAKNFGTAASKGTITLKKRAAVTGGLVIGNEGVGSGRVIVKDNATFHITNLEMNTVSDKGGMAEIHIMGGTVRIETDENVFDLLMADQSRKIILGDRGTLRIDSSLPASQKKEIIEQLIVNKSLIPAPGYRLSTPILQDEMLIARAEDIPEKTDTQSEASLMPAIDNLEPSSLAAPLQTHKDLDGLVKALHKDVYSETNSVAEAERDEAEEPKPNTPHLAGYIVFMGTILLTLRKPVHN